MQKLGIRRGSLAGVLGVAAIAAAAATGVRAVAAEGSLALDNLSFTLGATSYKIPHLEIEGASLSAADLAALWSGDEKAVDSRLARLSARRLTIPTLTAERRVGDAVERSTYRNLTARDLAGGRIGEMRAGTVEQTVEKPDGSGQSILWSGGVLKGVDLRQAVHMSLATRLDPQEALKPLIDEETVETFVMTEKNGRFGVRTGRIAVSGVKGRAFAAAPAQLLERLQRRDPDHAEADPALLKELIDAVSSLDVAALEIRDVAATGKGEPADAPYSIRLGRFAADRLVGATIGSLAFEDFALTASDGGRVALKRFDLRDARLASLVEAPFPQFGHIGLEGLTADIPDARLDAASRMKVSLARAEANFADFREIAPTKLSARLDRFVIDLAARGESPSTAQFLALGYRDLDLSAALDGEWQEKTQEAVFAPLRVEGRDMGAATLGVTFGNVSGAVFSSMAIVSKAAALASSLKSVDFSLEGGGLVDRLLALEAKQQKTPVERARADYARSAELLVAAALGGGDKAKRIADAVSAYILKPKRLDVRLSAPAGLSAVDLLARRPADILEGLEVQATAER
jgi:hypothetical protein